MAYAYAIGHITINDEKLWDEYKSMLPATLEPWGAELMFRGKLFEVLSGNHEHMDTVVLRFPDMQSLNNWHDSPEYQLLIPLRNEAADVDLLAYEE